jgi:penicillin-binding protein 1A
MTKKTKIKKHIKLSTIISFFVLLLMVLTLTVAATGFAYISSVIAQAPTLDPTDFESQQSTKIYDKDGVLITDIGMELRDIVTYDDLSQTTIDAFLAIEDSRFFEHNGFDVPRFIKVSLETLKTLDFGAGGSTLTMQLVKNTYFGSQEQIDAEGNSIIDKINRKIKEIYLALEAEKVLSKERILELYLNKINFGVPLNKRGIQTAAQYYFGKKVTDLTLVESALLAGIINKPSTYNPLGFSNPDINYLQESIDRTHQVLYLMVVHGYITEEEYDQAIKIDIENLLVGSLAATANTPYQSYIDTVINEVIQVTGQNPVDVPMVIYTSMDRTVQNQVESIQNGDGITWVDERLQMGSITLNNQTGEIIAIGGGRFYSGERLFNRATDMFRQPGSSMKPVLSYLLAFEYLGWSTKHMLSDEPYSYSTTNPEMIVGNVNGTYQGDVMLEYALGWSLNIPAILTLKQVVSVIGSSAVVDHLNAMGFTDVTLGKGDMAFDLGYAIGGSSLRVSPYQMAAAYAVLFNEGQYIQPHTVTRIEFLDGTAPLVPSYSKTQVISAEASYLMSRLVINNVTGDYFTGYKKMRRDYPTFLKSGTSDWGKEGIPYGIPENADKDLWFLSGSTEYTTALWIGFDNAVKGQLSYVNDAIKRKNYRETISSLILDSIYSTRNKPGDLVKPADVVSITHVLGISPYVSILPTMNETLAVTGYIKKSFANIPQLTVPAVYDPTSMTLDLQPNGALKHLRVTMNDYPDPLALILAPNTREMTLTVGPITITSVGKKLFDYSWIFGPVQYFARIVVDGVTINTLSSSSPIMETDLDITPANSVIVCSYYGYQTASDHSQEICEPISFANMNITSPITITGNTVTSLEAWFALNGLTNYTITYQMPLITEPAKLGTVASISNLNANTTYTYEQLSTLHFDIVVYDKEINLYSEFIGKAYARPTYYDYLNFTEPSIGSIVNTITVNYFQVDGINSTFKLSELYQAVQLSSTRLSFN